MTNKICECGGIMNYDPYFKANVCNTCGKKRIRKDDKDYFAIFCKCGCGNGAVLKADRKEGSTSLQLVSDNFYLRQNEEGLSFIGKIKRIWHIIRGKEYEYFDIFIEKNELKEFKNFVSRI